MKNSKTISIVIALFSFFSVMSAHADCKIRIYDNHTGLLAGKEFEERVENLGCKVRKPKEFTARTAYRSAMKAVRKGYFLEVKAKRVLTATGNIRFMPQGLVQIVDTDNYGTGEDGIPRFPVIWSLSYDFEETKPDEVRGRILDAVESLARDR